jgi:hypothetical protein
VITLSDARRAELVEALAEAFTPEVLERLVMDPLGMPQLRSFSRAHRHRVEELVAWIEGEGRVADLVRTASQANSSNPHLRVFAEATGLVPATTSLVEAVRGALPEGGEAAWLRGLTDAQDQVCWIEIRGGGGTGFLVGPDQIMTHAAIFSGGDASPDAVVWFGEAGSEGAERYELAPDPIVFRSGRGPMVLRLSGEAARGLGGPSARRTRARGWVTARPASPAAPGAPVVIVQREAGHAVTVSADGVLEASPDDAGIHYSTTTLGGSAGAPCFDVEWRLLGVHAGSGAEGWGFGSSIEGIVAALGAEGFAWDESGGIRRTRAPATAPQGSALDAVLRSIDVAALSAGDSDDVWDDDLDDSAGLAEERWAWTEAAAVVAHFDPARLRPLTDARPEARVPLLLESQLVRRTEGEERWLLPDGLRRRALQRLARRGQLRAARAANPGDEADPLDELLGAALSGAGPTAVDTREPERLRAMLQVVTWLDGIVSPLPDAGELRAALERAELIAPFRHLTQGFFAGRGEELARLEAHVESPQRDARGAAVPILIYAPGGMGKSSLLAHFILAYADRDPATPTAWRPFVYLDFDRPDLDATDLAGVLLAIARQLGPQVPALGPRADALVTRWTERQRREAAGRTPGGGASRSPGRPSRARNLDLGELVGEVASLLRDSSDQARSPCVVVLDTLEEVQYASPDAIVPLVEILAKLSALAPNARPVLSGRIDVTGGDVALDRLALGALPPGAAEAMLQNHLPPELAARTSLVSEMVARVGGNPLSLRLAAEVLRREAQHPDQAVCAADEGLWRLIGDAILQGRLYERIVGHIHDGPVKKLAVPGLVLRRITWRLIRDVLAAPCQIVVPDEPTARALFAELAAEVALVRQGSDPETLEVRPELRRAILDDLGHDPASATAIHAIHEAAVVFYAAGTSAAERAEEIYHRLALDQDPDAVDRRWTSEVKPLLLTAVYELPPRGRAYLANRVGLVMDAAGASTASQAEWEAWAESRATDLLQLGAPGRALEVLAARTDWTLVSRLPLIESIARRSLPTPDLEGARDAAEKAVGAARRSANAGYVREALDELVQVSRLRGDTAGVLRSLAELGDLGSELGDDLILLQAEVEALETVGPASPRDARFSERAVRVFGRLPDELVARAPELARRVAAQVGAEDPATLARVIRLVGCGSFDASAAEWLEDVLRGWEQTAPDMGPFVPERHASPRVLTNALQYLVTSRPLDHDTARAIASWMGDFVTPKASSSSSGSGSG